MYVKNSMPKTKEEIAENLAEIITKRGIKKYTPEEFKMLVDDLFGLNNAIVNKWDVWADCVKEPRNLDSGNHYYSVFYISKNHQKTMVWPHNSGKKIPPKKEARNWASVLGFRNLNG
jgi:hypothetical protein